MKAIKIVTLEFITLFYRVRIMLVERRSQHPLRILQAFLPFKGACAIDLSVLECDVWCKSSPENLLSFPCWHCSFPSESPSAAPLTSFTFCFPSHSVSAAAQ